LERKESDDTVQEIKQTLEMLDVTGDSSQQSSWMDSIDIQQYNGVAVVTIPQSAAAAALSKLYQFLCVKFHTVNSTVMCSNYFTNNITMATVESVGG